MCQVVIIALKKQSSGEKGLESDNDEGIISDGVHREASLIRVSRVLFWIKSSLEPQYLK